MGRGGVVRDDSLRQSAVEDVVEAGARLGYARLAQVDSRLAGPKGNREIFVYLAPVPNGSNSDCVTFSA